MSGAAPPPTDILSIIKDWQTLIVALPASVFAWWQLRSIKKTQQTETMFKLMARFDSGLHAERKAATESCLANLTTKHPDDKVDEIFDLFEDAAFSVTTRALDIKMMWHAFFYWIDLYYQASEKYLAERKQENPTQWSELRRLYPKLCEIEAKERRKAASKIRHPSMMTEAEIRKKLDEELSTLQQLGTRECNKLG